MKVIQTDYGNDVEILKFVDHFVGEVIQVSDENVTANEYGKKIVPAGSVLDKDGKVVNGSTAIGVLLHDVDVTYGSKAGTIVVHGFIDGTKLPIRELTSDCVSALKMIKFYDLATSTAPVITLTAGTMDTSTHKVKVAVKVEDDSTITACKYLYDSAAKNKADFASAGTAIRLTNGVAEVEVTADDTADKVLTVYAKDAVGNEAVKTVTITQY